MEGSTRAPPSCSFFLRLFHVGWASRPALQPIHISGSSLMWAVTPEPGNTPFTVPIKASALCFIESSIAHPFTPNALVGQRAPSTRRPKSVTFESKPHCGRRRSRWADRSGENYTLSSWNPNRFCLLGLFWKGRRKICGARALLLLFQAPHSLFWV